MEVQMLLGSSPLMRELAGQVIAAAGSKSLLLTGETGVGKSRIARAIHALGARSSQLFAELECDLRPEETLAGEFENLVAAASNGTLYLEEIAALTPAVQARLLEVLALYDAPRIIASSERDLATEVTEQRFDETLYYRLGATSFSVPPLRARTPEDIADIASSLLREVRRGLPDTPRTLSDDAIAAIARYPWPGNLRELRNALERALLRSRGAQRVDLMHLPAEVMDASESVVRAQAARTLAEVERSHIERTLRAHRWNRTHTALALGISRATLIKKIRDFEAADRSPIVSSQESA